MPKTSDREAEAGGEGAAGGPAEEAEEGRERDGAAVEEELVGAVDRGGDAGGVREWGGEVEQQERGEEDGPDEELVDAHVDGVAVVRAVEGVVPLQVQEAAAAAAAAAAARLRHGSPDPLGCLLAAVSAFAGWISRSCGLWPVGARMA